MLKRSQEEIEYAFETFIEGVQNLIDHHMHTRFPTLPPVKIEIWPGSKYWKIVRVDNGVSVFGFVRKSDGAILKPASWRAPFVKGPSAIRGYVTDPNNGLSSITAYGVVYAK